MGPTLIEPLGDCAFLAHFAGKGRRGAGLRLYGPGGGRGSGMLCWLIGRWPSSRSRNRSTSWSWNRGSGRSSRPMASRMQPGRSLVMPVLYDGADLHVVAARLGLSSADVIALHSSVEFDVFGGRVPAGISVRGLSTGCAGRLAPA